jgi:hypothetical protein
MGCTAVRVQDYALCYLKYITLVTESISAEPCIHEFRKPVCMDFGIETIRYAIQIYRLFQAWQIRNILHETLEWLKCEKVLWMRSGGRAFFISFLLA